MPNNTSSHILNTATNLLGFCLVVITSMHFGTKAETSYIDEVTSVIAIMLTLSCIFSFLSIKSRNDKMNVLLEKIADYFFGTSLFGLLIIILLISLHYLS